MSKLFEPFKIKTLELKNRLVMAPMCMYQSDDEGKVKNFHMIHYGSRAVGGIGLIILEATAVERRGRITSYDLGLWDDRQIEGMKNLVNELKKYGAKVGVQLGHAGRKCGSKGDSIIAPSQITFSDRYDTPSAMSLEDIQVVINAFKEAANRAKLAGFDTIELHGAHGYLINQFLSPLSNKREDGYGGSLENRARFLMEVIEAVKSVWPEDLPIMLRVSAEEYMENGNHPSDVAKIINLVKEKGIDIVDVSSGGVVHEAVVKPFPGYQVTFAEVVKKETGLVTVAGGLVTHPEAVEEILQNNRADLVFMGRELLRDPYFILHAMDYFKEELDWPTSYKRGRK